MFKTYKWEMYALKRHTQKKYFIAKRKLLLKPANFQQVIVSQELTKITDHEST